MSVASERPDELVEILASEFQFIIGFVIIEDRKADGVGGGTFNSGAWRTRVLNTTVLNTMGSVFNLAANRFTLGRGVYILFASAPAFNVNSHAARLRNITGGATIATGSAEYSRSGVGGTARSVIRATFSITGNTVFEIQHRCQSSSANGFGFPTSFAVDNEVYTQVTIFKIG